jgi:putative Ca2+/H+ antiporter (TMEM165/GDT1 family)
MKSYLLVFATVFLAELGDKTQLATLVYAASPDANRAGIFAAAAAALALSSLLAVIVGSQLGAWLDPRHLRTVAGLAFIGIGIWMLVARG